MMMTDYRAFGECQKTILSDGQSIDLTTPPGTYSVGTPAALSRGYMFMHIVTMSDTVCTVGLAFDIQASTTYNLTLVGQAQIVGVKSIAVTTGIVEVLLFL